MSEEKRKRPRNIQERRTRWIDAVLEDGERVQWVGVAVLKRMVYRHWVAITGAVVMCAIGAAFLHSGYRFVEEDLELFGYRLTQYFGVLYLLIAAGFGVRVWGKLAPRRRPITVITDRRLLLIDGFFWMRGRDVPPHIIGRVQVRSWSDGTGEITVYTVDPLSSRRSVTFPALPDVNRAAELIDELVAQFELPVDWEYEEEASTSSENEPARE